MSASIWRAAACCRFQAGGAGPQQGFSQSAVAALFCRRTPKAADTTALEREVDARVYRLYLPAPRLWQAGGLTPEEIKMVEAGAK